MPFTDNFNGEASEVDLAAHVPSGGTAWTRVGGAANYITVISAGWAVSNISSDSAYLCDDQGSSAHYTQYISKSTNQQAFVCNRISDFNNFVGVRHRLSTPECYKRVSGSFTLLGTTSASASIDTDTIRLESNASNQHTVFINGVQALQFTDAFNSTQTRQGLISRGSRLSMLDNYEAGPLSAPAPTITGITASNITSSGARITLGLTR